MKNAGFTLAEVLITLGMIGVVAAMTMPTIVAAYQKKETVTRLKETYSILQQTVRMSELDNGEYKDWDHTGNNWFDIYLANYLSTYKRKDFPALGEDGAIQYKQISGKPETCLMIIRQGGYFYSLPNGSELVTMHVDTTGTGNMLVDINGTAARPNQFGKDAFLLGIFNQNGLYADGMFSTTECTVPQEGAPGREFLRSDPCYQYACNKNSRDMWCGALIITDGRDIKKDYPW